MNGEKDYFFGEMFKKGVVSDVCRLEAVAIALVAWGGSCLYRAPENFGVLMAELSMKHNLPFTIEELIVLSKELRGAA